MKIIRLGLIGLLIMAIATQSTACWNYKEIERIAIVAGFAIDQDVETGRYTVTTEVIEILLGAKEKQISAKLLTSDGETVFDAVRNLISISGEKLYWSHAVVCIIGKEIAEKGIVPALDFVHRDAEPRYDLYLIVAEGKASSIFEECQNSTSGILSFMIADTLVSEKSLSKTPQLKAWEFINEMEDEDQSAIIPMIRVVDIVGKKIPKIQGTGIFKKDKLIGSLDAEETKILLFITNEIKGGLIVVQNIYKNSEAKVALEIFDNKTKIKPQILDDQIVMKMHLQTLVALGENTGTVDFNKEENLKKLKEAAEKEEEEKIQKLIKKVQTEYGSDIFGFGNLLEIHDPNEWDKVKDYWNEVFVLVDVEVKAEINIRNTGFMAKPIKVGE